MRMWKSWVANSVPRAPVTVPVKWPWAVGAPSMTVTELGGGRDVDQIGHGVDRDGDRPLPTGTDEVALVAPSITATMFA